MKETTDGRGPFFGGSPVGGLGLTNRARVREVVLPHLLLLAVAFGVASTACSDDDGSKGSGTLAVSIQAEETITDGLEPGTGSENIVDGWSVRFEKYVVALGDVRLGKDATHVAESSGKKLALDLTTLAQGGRPFTELPDIEATQYDFFGYALVPAGDAERDSTVSEADFAEMVTAGASYLIEGSLEKSDGQSCPPGGQCRAVSKIDFRLVVPAHVAFGPCELESVPQPGVVVTEGGTSEVGITLHGDHMFFDAFPTGDEVVHRRAQWLADADVDQDDRVDFAELGSIRGADLSDLFPSAEYSLGTWTKTSFPLESAADVVQAQLSTQGHYQGEGECLWTLLP